MPHPAILDIVRPTFRAFCSFSLTSCTSFFSTSSSARRVAISAESRGRGEISAGVLHENIPVSRAASRLPSRIFCDYDHLSSFALCNISSRWVRPSL